MESEKEAIQESKAMEDQDVNDAAGQETTATAKEESADEIARLKSEAEQKEKLLQESVDRVKRLQADFDNYRRRTRQEKEELSAVVAQSLIKDLLPLLDNFERALAADLTKESASLKEGVDMIYKQLVAALEKHGLEGIKAVGEKFDPNFHEAIMRVADESKEDDTVAEELQKGYSVRGRVIRPSMVKVIGN